MITIHKKIKVQKKQIRGVSVHRPWGHAIAHLSKDIENRSWNCPLPIDSYLAIHNGKKWDEDSAECLKYIGYTVPCVEQDPAGAIIAIAIFKGNVTESTSKWHEKGSIGWQLANVVTIQPVFCKGQQGLWYLESSVLKEVRASYMAKAHLYNFTK
jgi:hypothetical protein